MSHRPLNPLIDHIATTRHVESFRQQKYIVVRSATDATKLAGHDELGPCIRSAEAMGGVVRRTRDGAIVWPTAAMEEREVT